MEKIVSLCKRRGFIFQAGELCGCWDYGPLGTELKRNATPFSSDRVRDMERLLKERGP